MSFEDVLDQFEIVARSNISDYLEMKSASMFPLKTIASTSVAVMLAASGSANDGDWVPLFNGKTLDGWHQKNGFAHFDVRDGELLGTSVPNSPNSFLFTKEQFGDFELEFEVQVDKELNSGVQIRSHSNADFQDGRVHGYQVEIAVHGYSGGIYDEARRGKFLNEQPVTPEIRNLVKAGQWARYRVVCSGDRLQVWVNGVKVTDLKDDVTKTGHIGLQVHGVGKRIEPLHVKWRNIRLRKL